MKKLFVCLFILCAFASVSFAKGEKVNVGVTSYLSYETGKKNDEEFNEFKIKRGYLNVKVKPTKWLEARLTPDFKNDGIKLKYAYGKIKLPVTTFLISKPNVELGLVHTPWLDFEQKINRYRMGNKMFMDKNGVMNSADLGATLTFLLGDELPKWYQSSVNKNNPGVFGSASVGVYNGGGYKTTDENENKVFMSRVSLRPLGLWFPYLQLHHGYVGGKGNTQESPKYELNNFATSLESKYFVLVGQYMFGYGDKKGKKVDNNGNSLKYWGTSAFGEIRIPYTGIGPAPDNALRFIGRYDYMNWEKDVVNTNVIFGTAYYFYKNNAVLLSTDRQKSENSPVNWTGQFTLQINL